MQINLSTEKLYFSIGETADAFGLSTATIRHWENEFDILRPKKNKKGDRLFSWDDIGKLQLIYSLVKEQGFTLKGAAAKLKEDKHELAYQKSKNEALNSLVELKGQLELLRDALD